MVTPDEYAGDSQFVHLHSHSVFSTLDGVCTPEQYAEQCYQRKYPGMAITEHGHMGSVPDMHFAFKKYGLKFMSGCEIYFSDYEPERKQLTKSVKEIKQEDEDYYYNLVRNRHLTVIAKNEIGHTNLVKLTTQAYKTGFYYKPRIWFDKLCEYKEGLIILSGCLNGPVCHELRRVTPDGGRAPRLESNDKRGAIDWVRKFKEAFGDDYYIELQMPGVLGDEWVFRQLVHIADNFKIKPVISNDTHYLQRQDWQLQKIMMAIDQGLTVDSPDLFHVNSDEQYFKTRAELWARFKNHSYSKGIDDRVFEEACDNTLRIADQCTGLKLDTAPKMPSFEGADDKLRQIVARKLKEFRLDKITRRYLIDGCEVTYVDQAKVELDRIINKGFASYFLITQDLVSYGRSKGWPFSPRGSAGGSLVVYLLGISPINPLPWGLSFDRFLSPARGGFLLKTTMPES